MSASADARVAVLKGGISAEREVSLASGEQCAAALLTELGAVRSGDWIGCQVYASDQIIPEPATLTLLVAGGLVPLLKRRRR